MPTLIFSMTSTPPHPPRPPRPFPPCLRPPRSPNYIKNYLIKKMKLKSEKK